MGPARYIVVETSPNGVSLAWRSFSGPEADDWVRDRKLAKPEGIITTNSLYRAPIMVQWRNWTKRVQWRGPYFRSDELLRVRPADPLIVHNFEAESLVLGQAGHFCHSTAHISTSTSMPPSSGLIRP
jgi:hypothetical protein